MLRRICIPKRSLLRTYSQIRVDLQQLSSRSLETAAVIPSNAYLNLEDKVSMDNLVNKVEKLNFYIETYGCQMNLSDSEIVRSILIKNGYFNCTNIDETDIILTNTCAVRENAESKVWNRLKYFQSLRKKNKMKITPTNKTKRYYPIVGVLGCMAERLKEKLLLEDSVDFICGPDSYRDIPALLQNIVNVGQKQANTMLSFDETYADIKPVREVDSASAFVSIMRGCNNMCSFCIVPFTRGRERSRAMDSILSEIKSLSDNGVKEVVLLGQNVNGYHDTSDQSAKLYPISTYQVSSAGFTNLYQSRKRDLPGARFSDLLNCIADINADMRVRFTSPHPKDFPIDVLEAIKNKQNICKSIHLPVQSGSTSMLARMRRGYSREAYIELVQRCREMIPNVSISTDIIAGFCDETEEEHQDTISLLKTIQFDQAFMYAYSLRDRTHAAHTMQDNIPEDIKKRRLQEIIDTYREVLLAKNTIEESGAYRLVLVEGESQKSTIEHTFYTGRTDGNKRIIFPATNLIPIKSLLNILQSNYGINISKSIIQENMYNIDIDTRNKYLIHGLYNVLNIQQDDLISISGYTPIENIIGKYVLVRVLKSDTSTMRGIALGTCSIKDYYHITNTLIS